MINLQKPIRSSSIIAKSSPLFNYWESNQTHQDQKKRLIKCDRSAKDTELFILEPYKWEVLYQSSIKQLQGGDMSAIKGFKILLKMLKPQEQDLTIKALSENNILNEELLVKVKDEKSFTSLESKFNLRKFSRILFAIFFNTYGINIKTNKRNLYEYSAHLIYKVKEITALSKTSR